MCGIVAILRRGERPLPEVDTIRRMAEAIVHRGPDDWGYFASADVLIGAVRLAIVGVAGGRQPHRGCRDGLVAVANGEIYNHEDLKTGLAGHGLHDPCDTAVLPHLYEEHGEDLVERLRGMFAFAIWDAPEKKLVLARDRLGIKPLFLAETPEYLVVASEAKAIFASGLVAAEIDRDALDDLFSLGYPCPPRTMFRGVSQLRPAHVAVARPGRPLVTRRYWRAPFGESPGGRPNGKMSGSPRDTASSLREVLRAAMRDHLMGDVPVAAMLSGGLDSSAVAALAKEVAGHPLETFSLTFGGAEVRFDESRFSEAVAAKLGGRHHAVSLSRASAERLPDMIWALELPLIVPGAIGGLELADAERGSGFHVTLSGDGADELLGGYDVFRASKLKRGLAAWGLGPLEPLVIATAARFSAQPRGIARALRPKASAASLAEAWGGVIPPWLGSWLLLDVDRERLLSPGGRRPRPTLEPPAGFGALLHPDSDRLHPLDAEIALELETRLPAWILVISDRSAMARGVEVRVPLLDDRVVEAMLAVPPAMKMRGFNEKAILRAAVADLLPREIARRRKQPFMTPIASWFFEAGAPAFVGEALSKRSLEDTALFDPAAVARLREDFARARPNHVDRFRRELLLMLILGCQLLARQFTRGLDIPPPRFELMSRQTRSRAE